MIVRGTGSAVDRSQAHQLALSAHYGLPMLGRWDVAGLAASVVLALGGVAIGVWGFNRRDLRS